MISIEILSDLKYKFKLNAYLTYTFIWIEQFGLLKSLAQVEEQFVSQLKNSSLCLSEFSCYERF